MHRRGRRRSSHGPRPRGLGDIDGALEILLTHYERDGEAMLRTIALEEKLEAARTVSETGRKEHRAWCARVFGPFIPPSDSEAYDRRLDAFVAVTDLYLWKLLRRDIGRSADETKRTLRALIEGLVLLTHQP